MFILSWKSSFYVGARLLKEMDTYDLRKSKVIVCHLKAKIKDVKPENFMPAKNDIILETGLFFKECQNNRRSNFCPSRCRSQAPRCHKEYQGASLVAQWKRIHLPVQETRIQSLIWEDPTCHGTTMPMHHSYWACALEPGNCNYWAHVWQPLKP